MPLSPLQINGDRDETVANHGQASADGFFSASSKATAVEWNRGTGCVAESHPWLNEITEIHGLQCTASCAGSNKKSIDYLWPEGDHHWPGNPTGHGSNGYCVTELQQRSMPEQTLCVKPDVDVWGSRFDFDFFTVHKR